MTKMIRKRHVIFLVLAVISLWASGCASGNKKQEAEIAKSASASMTITPAGVPTQPPVSTPAPTEIPPATPTPAASPIVTAAITPTPSPAPPIFKTLYSTDATPLPPHTVKGLSAWMEPAMAVENDVIYMAVGSQEEGVYRYDIPSGRLEMLPIHSHFPGGNFTFCQAIVKNHRLIVLDVDRQTPGEFTWAIRMIELRTLTTKDILSVQDQVSYPGPYYDFDGERVLVQYNSHDDARHCEMSHLMFFDIITGETETIDAHCNENADFYWGPVYFHDNIIVAEKDIPKGKDVLNDLFILHKKSGVWHEEAFTNDGHSSMPVLDWPWLVWKVEKRFEWGRKNAIYSFETGETYFRTPPLIASPSDPRRCGQFVIWNYLAVTTTPGEESVDEAYLYRLPSGPLYKIPGKKGITRSNFSCNDRWVVWSEFENVEKPRGAGWAALPPTDGE